MEIFLRAEILGKRDRGRIPLGKHIGYAGAIIIGGAGTAESKINDFSNAGITVAEKPSDIAVLLIDIDVYWRNLVSISCWELEY